MAFSFCLTAIVRQKSFHSLIKPGFVWLMEKLIYVLSFLGFCSSHSEACSEMSANMSSPPKIYNPCISQFVYDNTDWI